MELLTRDKYCGGLDRVKITKRELGHGEIPEQVLVTFYSMDEIFNMYIWHFDKYGNLVLRKAHSDKVIDHLAPAHFADLGTTRHIHKECGFAIDKTFVKKFH